MDLRREVDERQIGSPHANDPRLQVAYMGGADTPNLRVNSDSQTAALRLLFASRLRASLEGEMIFALATDDCGLMIFRDEAEAVAYCEGIDVSEGGWEFFGSDGMPLQPHFSKSAARGKAVVESGEYSLHPAIEAGRPTLSERLGAVAYVEGPPGLASVSDVKRLLTSGSSGRPRRGRR